MQYLANAFRAAPVAQPTGAEMVERYCDRATHSTLIEDRRAAVLGLKGLAHEYKLDVGIKGMPILIEILNQDLRDTEITKAVLEALTILCSSEEEEEGKEKSESDDLSIQFTEILIKDSKNVTTLLQALEGNDFYVRFFTIQLLNSLMKNKPTQLQNCILTSPMGVSRLIDLLDDKREIIRNEGLLLLISLSKSNAEIQKIIAFENAFEKLLGIIIQEGATDGGIVVQDCLQLTHNLLRYNVSNQNLFRESSCIQVIPKLLVSKVLGPKNTIREISLIDSESEWTEQKIINSTLILGVIRILVVPNNPNTTLNQNVMQQCKMVDMLIDLAFSQKIPNKLRCQAFYAMADIIRGNGFNQDSFTKHVIQKAPDSQVVSPISSPRRGRQQQKIENTYPPQPIILAIVQIALNPSKNDEFSIRAAATYTFQCYVCNNPDGQLALLSTIMPPPEENPNDDITDKPQSPGTIILSSLLEWNTTRKDPYKTWFAAVLLSHILLKNEQCKLMALKLNLYEYDEQISLLHKCMYSYITATKENVDVRVLIGFLCLIAVWLYDCPKAVNEFLKEGAHVSILIEEIIQSSEIDIAVQGLAAFLFGICYEFNDDSEPSFTREKIQPIIMNRIGVDLFISRFDRLKESEYIEKVSPYLQILTKETKDLPKLYFDFAFVELFKSSYETISRSIIKPKKEDPDTVAFAMCKNKVAELEEKVKSLELNIEEKNKEHDAIAKDNENFQNLINNLNENSQKLTEEIKQKNEKITELENQLVNEKNKLNEKISELEKKLIEKDEQIQILDQKNIQFQQVRKSQEIEKENYTSNLNVIELTNKNNALLKELETQKTNYQLLEQEQDDLLVCLAEHDLEIRKLKMKLIKYGEDIVIEDDDDDDDSSEEENMNEQEKKIDDSTIATTTSINHELNEGKSVPSQMSPQQINSINLQNNPATQANEEVINNTFESTTSSYINSTSLNTTQQQPTQDFEQNQISMYNTVQSSEYYTNKDSNVQYVNPFPTSNNNENTNEFIEQSELTTVELSPLKVSTTTTPTIATIPDPSINNITNEQNQQTLSINSLLNNTYETNENDNVPTSLNSANTTTVITTPSQTLENNVISPIPFISNIVSETNIPTPATIFTPPPAIQDNNFTNVLFNNNENNSYITPTTQPIPSTTDYTSSPQILNPNATAIPSSASASATTATTTTTAITPSSIISPPPQNPNPNSTLSNLPPPPTNTQGIDLLSQSSFVNSPSSSRRHNRHLYHSYVPQVSFLPQTQFPNN